MRNIVYIGMSNCYLCNTNSYSYYTPVDLIMARKGAVFFVQEQTHRQVIFSALLAIYRRLELFSIM